MAQQSVQSASQSSQIVSSSQAIDTRSASELDAAARKRAANVQLKPQTQVSPNPNAQSLHALQTESAFDTEATTKLSEDKEKAESLSGKLQILQAVMLFAFGMLLIISIGAIVFYGLDFAMSLFDFDLHEYTQWIILLLAFLNLIFSCFGCFGTYKFKTLRKENEAKLTNVTKKLQENADGLEKDEEALGEELRKFEVEITHIENLNKELRATLSTFSDHKNALIQVKRGTARLYVDIRELWNLFKIYETNDMICRILKITAEYYKRAYQDGDTEPGLNEEQYDDLFRSSAIPRNEKVYFPSFNNKVWDKNGRFGKIDDGPILVDELERVCVLIYKRILQKELEIELSKQQTNGSFQNSLDLTKQLLDDSKQDSESDDGFFTTIRNVFGGD